LVVRKLLAPGVITADAATTRCIVPRRCHAIGDGSVTGRMGKVLERKWARRLKCGHVVALLRQKSAICRSGKFWLSPPGLSYWSEIPIARAGVPMSPLVMKIAPWLLLIMSNVFMTYAWYGHLKGKAMFLPVAILSSWLIALPEYMLAVPANRIGHSAYSAAQLKTGQEAITLIVFTLFSVFYLGEAIRWTTLIGFALIFCGVAMVFFFK
jgi:uncharacterized protein (DUF486 family)